MTAVRLDEMQLQAAYYCAAEVLRSRTLAGQPIPFWLHRHYRHLDTAVLAAVSDSGHESGSGAEQLERTDELITAREAAAMLGCSKRQVQRIASDLDGQIIGGRWLFDRRAVQEYAEGMHR